MRDKQRRILEFTKTFLETKGYPPTVRDIQKACDISSTSVVDYNLNILERGGHIRRDPEVSRGIELIEPGGKTGSVSVPIAGVVAAGDPISVPSAEVWRGMEGLEILDVPATLLGDRKEVYALKVRGLSMIDAFINDGDFILVHSNGIAENGQMVVAWLKEEREVTLKRLYREEGRIRLQPANTEMSPIYTHGANLEIQGVVIGVFRVL